MYVCMYIYMYICVICSSLRLRLFQNISLDVFKLPVERSETFQSHHHWQVVKLLPKFVNPISAVVFQSVINREATVYVWLKRQLSSREKNVWDLNLHDKRPFKGIGTVVLMPDNQGPMYVMIKKIFSPIWRKNWRLFSQITYC
jgi:hypothetical protein